MAGAACFTLRQGCPFDIEVNTTLIERFHKDLRWIPLSLLGEESGPVRDLGQGGSLFRNAPQLAVGSFIALLAVSLQEPTAARFNSAAFSTLGCRRTCRTASVLRPE